MLRSGLRFILYYEWYTVIKVYKGSEVDDSASGGGGGFKQFQDSLFMSGQCLFVIVEGLDHEKCFLGLPLFQYL